MVWVRIYIPGQTLRDWHSAPRTTLPCCTGAALLLAAAEGVADSSRFSCRLTPPATVSVCVCRYVHVMQPVV